MGKKTDTSKPAAAAAPAAKAAAAKKPAVKKATAKSPAATAGKTAGAKTAFTRDDIALRAYFISEKRHKAGLPGDAAHDWIEAERQLITESKMKPAAKGA